METITIPSPTAFLMTCPAFEFEPLPPPPSPTPRKASTNTRATANSKKKEKDGVVKPKQSKSRNGCITCKTKRLKCDETKPTCHHCHKRNVPCGGYKKDFKWRPFEEATLVNKPAGPRTKRNSIVLDKPPDFAGPGSPVASEDHSISSEDRQSIQMEDTFFDATAPLPPVQQAVLDISFNNSPIAELSTLSFTKKSPGSHYDPDHVTSSLSSLFEDINTQSPGPSSSGQSPRLIDLLLPSSELKARPGNVVAPPLMTPQAAIESQFTFNPMMEKQLDTVPLIQDKSGMGEGMEGIIPSTMVSDMDMWMSLRSQLPTALSSYSSPRDDPFNKIYRQPDVQPGSPEMLMLRFDKQTCGILSVKDGPTENPWRTLVWPLARGSPALYHAISSMTAFHTSKALPVLRVDGMEHMRQSIHYLASGIDKMRTDTALATTLVLAFSESWDQHISTGIEHLRGAKILVNQALICHQKRNLAGDDLARLKFLCNTWVYMDVIARLTSINVDETIEFCHDDALWPYNASLCPSSPTTTNTELDPLMGCAGTLFPLIGRVANLCRRVRKAASNSIAIISQAIELKEVIKQWEPPPVSAFDRPEDPTSEIQHALQTAEAYRYAALLYLHQAVPEIPSPTAAQLAKKVLVYLATVPLSSRLVIVQIYPLLAAGCEAWDTEDRQWVESRWNAMSLRMWIGNIDRCKDVQKEVWARRDKAWILKLEKESRKRPGQDAVPVHSESSKRQFEEELAMDEVFSFSDLLAGSGASTSKRPITNGNFASQEKRRREGSEEDMNPELTVRGRLHWVGVMTDWGWEILLG
ncbi:fungal-specific transcription factor domain-containing protein [Calycina marina]|uniref:Fungal-specific transcription factor domain-containing protein n=1 Tax=Calycina marina TaxID=1763456 RepID=A0A9P8CIV9_9HELO|nr:fungal-specific transcription factor domain-containing protein [Calycina marina]